MTPTDAGAATLQVVLNGVWQGAALTVAAAIIVRAARPGAATRHAVWTLALLAVVCLPCLSALRSAPTRAARGPFVLAGAPVAEAVAPGRAEAAAASAARPVRHGDAVGPLVPFTLPARWTLILVAVMGAVSALGALRVLAAVFALRRLASGCRPLDARRESRLAGWSALRLSSRRVRLCVSDDVAAPLLIGLVDPVIAVPERLLSELSDVELDQVALHELAHVRRRDDWWALAEKLIAGCFFFQPAVHWIARRVEREREMACDEWVVAATGAPRPYAACLLRLGEWASAGPVSFLAPSAAPRGGQLSRRIEALVAAADAPQPRRSRASLLAAVAALSAVTVFVSTAPGVTVLAQAAATAPAGVAGGTVSEESLRAEVAAAIRRDDTAGEDPATRRIALSALGERAGSVIVMATSTGRVLTIVNQDWAVRRGFSPASTIKLVTGIAALRAHTLDPERKVAVTHPRQAQMSFEQAIALSSNDYFLAAGQQLGFDRFLSCARELGMGEPTGVDLPNEYAGRLPSQAGWSFTAGEGFEVTPIQLATLVAAIGNGGVLVTPSHGALPVVRRIRRRLEIPEEVLGRVKGAMVAAVAYGTGKSAQQKRWTVAGKTGTWQEGALFTGVFVSLAPAEDPKLAIVAVVRGSDVLGATAAALAGRVYSAISSTQAED
jgi:beta-lactamase regulating signal transducer with metallopeptidase domain